MILQSAAAKRGSLGRSPEKVGGGQPAYKCNSTNIPTCVKSWLAVCQPPAAEVTGADTSFARSNSAFSSMTMRRRLRTMNVRCLLCAAVATGFCCAAVAMAMSYSVATDMLRCEYSLVLALA